MNGLSPMEALLLAAANGQGLFGAEEDEENDDDNSQGEESDDKDKDESKDDDADGKDDEGDDESDKDKDKDNEELEGLLKAKKRLLDEKKKLAVKLAAAEKKLQEAQGPKPEAEQLTEAQATIAANEERIKQLTLDRAFLSNNTHDWEDAALALSLADMDSVTIDDDGEVHGLKEALADLAKNRPYLLKKKAPATKRTGDPASKKDDKASQAAREAKLRSKYNLRK